MGVLAFQQEMNPRNNRIKKNERANRDIKMKILRVS